MDHDTTRYRIELEMLERETALANPRAIELLRSELALALNASYLMALSGGDIQVGAIWRTVPRDGVGRYAVELLLEERRPQMSDDEVSRLVQRELQHAQNASHFLRIAREDFTARLIVRERIVTHEALRAA
ncbi:MAG TPA: hypothetical protein VNT54_10305 [Solirubrobacteraceae bacterium]|nr:hypothetical protein [Solirubrobacteraceae bacterium]